MLEMNLAADLEFAAVLTNRYVDVSFDAQLKIPLAVGNMDVVRRTSRRVVLRAC